MPATYRMAAADTLELNLVGAVGDGWAEEPITKKAVSRALRSAGNAKTIKVHLDSFGGSYFEGVAIYQLLSEHPARVEMEIGACAASAASTIAMAGDEITMHDTSTMLIHEVWTIAMGNASDLRKEADDLELLSKQAAKAYAARSGMTEDEAMAIMAEDRYMSADEALKLGLCTKIRKSKTRGKNNAAMLTESYVRSQIESIKSEAQERLGSRQMAASTENPTTAKPYAGEEQEMNPELILAALGLPEGATTEQIAAFAAQAKADRDASAAMLAAIGADSVDAAVGKVKALSDASARAEKAERELSEHVQAASDKSKADLITCALDPNGAHQHAGKLSPGMRAWAEKQSLETLEGYLSAAPKLVSSETVRQPHSANSYTGKSYKDMTSAERSALHAENPELFKQLRSESTSGR